MGWEDENNNKLGFLVASLSPCCYSQLQTYFFWYSNYFICLLYYLFMLSPLCRFCSTEWEDYYEWWICENMKGSGHGLNLDVSKCLQKINEPWTGKWSTLSFSLLISNVNIRIWMNNNTQVHSHSFSYVIVIWLFQKISSFCGNQRFFTTRNAFLYVRSCTQLTYKYVKLLLRAQCWLRNQHLHWHFHTSVYITSSLIMFLSSILILSINQCCSLSSYHIHYMPK